MLRDNIYIHPPSFLFLCLWECDISIEGRRPGHCTEYSAHVFNVKTSPAGSCSIFPQSTWALCPKRWDFLCIHVTGCLVDHFGTSATLPCLVIFGPKGAFLDPPAHMIEGWQGPKLRQTNVMDSQSKHIYGRDNQNSDKKA